MAEGDREGATRQHEPVDPRLTVYWLEGLPSQWIRDEFLLEIGEPSGWVERGRGFRVWRSTSTTSLRRTWRRSRGGKAALVAPPTPSRGFHCCSLRLGGSRQ